jgi:F420-non-reducing hydrogenase iron-sulfur subunit
MEHEMASRDGFEPVIVGFCCHYCAYAAADLAGVMRLRYPTNIRIIKLPCSGTIDISHILKAFEEGADGVFVAGCLKGTCHFIDGNIHAEKRVAQAKAILGEIGLGAERLEMFFVSASEGPQFAKQARELTDKIKQLGPSPIKRKL